ncbi:hypothetical protein GCM10011609_86770 [Lentzea pudingi]|uniref:Uncharacterized protein n=1 Tax=Lentzea pudingi TaxID=1789439 RepID=A0ABQ2ISZ4_9PSEU|nr:hypothetical protein GCM10011609_86770 [Lentzea pudingi]
MGAGDVAGAVALDEEGVARVGAVDPAVFGVAQWGEADGAFLGAALSAFDPFQAGQLVPGQSVELSEDQVEAGFDLNTWCAWCWRG